MLPNYDKVNALDLGYNLPDPKKSECLLGLMALWDAQFDESSAGLDFGF